MIIIGVDPGAFTGMAWLDTKDDTGTPPIAVEVPARDTGLWLSNWLGLLDVTVIACEKYVMTSGIKTAQPDALMQMGVVEYLAAQNDIRLVWQFPREAKKMCPDSLLRRLGWFYKTKDGHANDALRHCVLGLAGAAPEEYAKLIGI